MCCFFFCKQKTAYEVRISDWSSDVCSSDLQLRYEDHHRRPARPADLVEADRPGIEERRFQVEDDEEDRDEVESHVELAARRSEERRVGKGVSVRVDLGGRRISKKKRKTNHRIKV